MLGKFGVNHSEILPKKVNDNSKEVFKLLEDNINTFCERIEY